MSLYIDKKYASLVSVRLERFKWKGEEAQFRCPICGDSVKNKFKTRGGFFPNTEDDLIVVGCFNCGYYKPFGAFLKHMDPNMHKEYVLENFKHDNTHKWISTNDQKQVVKVQKIAPCIGIPILHLQCVANLDPFHPAAVYIRERKIPFQFYGLLYYTDNYKKFVHDHIDSTKFEKYPESDPRIVIPFFSASGAVFAWQGRSLNPKDEQRYITINPVPDNILLYGVERLKDNIPTYVVEGPFDSMFIPNCVAVAGSSLTKLLKYKKLNLTFIFDNEAYSKEICKLMDRVITEGKSIVIWPSTIKEKDINDMVLAEKNVLDIIAKNSYTGLLARMKFNEWKKI
jgi:hypothetical protein